MMFTLLFAWEFDLWAYQTQVYSLKWGKSSLVVEVKEKEDSDPILLELKGAVHNHKMKVFSQWVDGVLSYQGKLRVLMWESWSNIFLKKLITPGILFIQVPLRCTAICGKSIGGLALRGIYHFVSRCPNFQQVKVEHQKPRGMTQEIDIHTWKWDVINMNFHHRVTSY